MVGCKRCGTALIGRQRAFCSVKCKQTDINNRLQCYRLQKDRGRERKLHLIRAFGGVCQRCGYSRNHAALVFHHIVPRTKAFQLDMRALSNRTWQRVLDEAAKCQLLCSNCHFEVHHPECAITAEVVSKAISIRTRRKYVHRAA